jgi:hypothetical protein
MNITLPIRIGKFAALLIFVTTALQAQQLKLGTNPTILRKSALLELESATQGLLLTRISDTTTATSPLKTASDGTLIYYTPDNSLYIRSLGAWSKLATGSGTGSITLSGDLTGTGTGTVPATINNQAVTFPKIQNIATQRLLGRYTAGTGSIEQLTLNSSLKLNASGVLYADSALAIWNASKIQSRRVLDTVPGTGDVLKWNPTRAMWLPSQDITGGAAYGTLTDNDIRNATAPDPQYRMKIWASPITNTVQQGPLGTGAYAWSVLSFQMQSGASAFTTQLYFDKNTLALKEWGGVSTLTSNAGNPWYKVVTTHGDNSFTDGGIIFAGKTSDASTEVRQDADNLFWDNTNKELGIGTNAPAAKLDVDGDFKLGTGGTVFTNMFKLLNVAVNDGTAFSNTTTREITVNLATPLGTRTIATGATVILNPRTNLPERLGIGYVRRASNTTIIIGLTNTGANASLGTINFDITIIQ